MRATKHKKLLETINPSVVSENKWRREFAPGGESAAGVRPCSSRNTYRANYKISCAFEDLGILRGHGCYRLCLLFVLPLPLQFYPRVGTEQYSQTRRAGALRFES